MGELARASTMVRSDLVLAWDREDIKMGGGGGGGAKKPVRNTVGLWTQQIGSDEG